MAVTAYEANQVTAVTFDNVSVTPVNAPGSPGFTLSAITSAQSVDPGTSMTFGLSIGASGCFNGAVSFSVTGLPGGATPSFNPPSVIGSGTTTLTVSTAAAMLAGPPIRW
ncbi:MAG: hypothetical protein IT167_12720 [Bryobacterales bacterium]|nr:hypothetical protein [Bryobacterales bacterium]